MSESGLAIAAGPRIRRDLTIRRSLGGACVVKNPDSGAFFRMGEVEHFITEQLDGETRLETVRRRVEEKFQASLSRETLDGFVRRLERQGLLEGTNPASSPPAARTGRIRGRLLYLRFPIVDPDRILGWLAPRVSLFYTRGFAVCSALAIIAAIVVVLGNASLVAADLARLYQVALIPLALFFFLLIVTAHEFAHGVTCKRYGGSVKEMGFLLVYFNPAFYCNVSDAWLFPEKSKRLLVSFAGAYFELSLWAVATLAWWSTEPDTWVNQASLMVMAISGIKCFFNFNPFIKLDGYYLLSDFLEIPNFRRKAFAYVGSLIKYSWGLGPRPDPALPRRERRLYALYGGVAAASSFGLMAVAFVRAGGYLIDLGQPLALLLLTWLIGAKSLRRLRRLFGSRSRAKKTPGVAATVVDDDEEDEDPVDPPTKLPAVQEPGRMTTALTSLAQFPQGLVKPLRRVPRRILVLVPVVLLVLLMKVELRIPGPFQVLPEGNADVRSAVEGIVEKVLVTEGDSVRPGQVIAQLSARSLRADLNKAEAEIRENQSALKRLARGSTVDEISVARDGAARAVDKVTFAQTRLSRTRQLFDMGSATQQELEAAQEEAASAQNDLGAAQGRLKILQRSQPEAIEAARAQADRLEVDKRYLEEQLTLLDIVSPVTGIVATPEAQLRAMEGQLVSRGSLIARVYDFSSLTAQIVIPEKEIADVKVGSPVVLKARAYPDAQFKGLVTAIATTAEGTATATPGELTASLGSEGDSPAQKFIVTTRIANPELLLKPGMTGQAKVQGGQWRVIGLVKRRLARTFKVQFWSWW